MKLKFEKVEDLLVLGLNPLAEGLSRFGNESLKVRAVVPENDVANSSGRHKCASNVEKAVELKGNFGHPFSVLKPHTPSLKSNHQQMPKHSLEFSTHKSLKPPLCDNGEPIHPTKDVSSSAPSEILQPGLGSVQ